MTYCPLHNTRHGLPHGQICPDHSCECTWSIEDGIGVRHADRCEIHRDCTLEPIDGLIPSWVFTVPTEDPAEPRYMETLDADERGGH
jgi:hypothetical protein